MAGATTLLQTLNDQLSALDPASVLAEAAAAAALTTEMSDAMLASGGSLGTIEACEEAGLITELDALTASFAETNPEFSELVSTPPVETAGKVLQGPLMDPAIAAHCPEQHHFAITAMKS